MAESPKLLNIDDIKKDYPIHLLVWNNGYDELKLYLAGDDIGDEIEKKDVRGRSPLMLAVTLGHLEAAKLLMEKGANVNTVNSEGWNVVQEAVATGDPELVQAVLEWRDYQRYSTRVGGVPELLLKLKEAPDFYVEMKWEFTSWVPLFSSIPLLPSDTYKVYKKGSKVRIDTTLLGFDQLKWQRGNTSFIFQCTNDEATIMEIDHENKQVFFEEMRVITTADVQILEPNAESVSARLTTPIVTTYVDTDKICFERNKSGLWGWRQDKMEVVNGCDCKIFGASNVELVTKTRCEHLSDQDKAKYKGKKTPLQFLFGIDEDKTVGHVEYTHSGNPCQITPEEYFSPGVSLGTRDIGRPKEITTKIQKFKATLWLSEEYPLSLPEQIIPIIDLMAISNSHFAKLKHFIEMQLPAGFPVKIEIPLFHVLNASITFGNIFALDTPVEGVSTVEDGNNKLSCIVDDSCFQPPPSYTFMGAESRRQVSNLEEDDDMLQYAIQQSLLQSGHDDDQVDIWEALQAQRPNTPYLGDDEEGKQLQRAIEASLSTTSSFSGSGLVETDGTSLEENVLPASNTSTADEDLRRILELSEQEEKQRLETLEAERRREEEMLEQVLKLSLMDK